MTEDQLRALVREAVARHLGTTRAHTPASDPVVGWKEHASHARLPVLSGEQSDGPCLVEPGIRCHHCAFCQSFGH